MRVMRKQFTGMLLVFAMLFTAFVSVPAIIAQADEGTEFIHILYRTTGGELKAVWKFEVTRDQQTDVSADLMKDYDNKGVIGTIDDLRDITGIIVLKYRPERDADTAPSDLEAFLKTLSKEDTFQTGNPFTNLWTFDDPSGEMSWGGSLQILADDIVSVQKITIKNAPKTLAVGKSVTLKAVVKPNNASNKTLKWSVSNKKYAKISKKGKLTALKAGKGKTVKVTASATDGTDAKVMVKIKIK